MPGQRYYFEEPVVRINLARGHFPKICPVCGNKATKLARITIVAGRQQYLLRSWDPYYSPSIRRRQDLPKMKMKVLPIYTCDDHYFSDDGQERYKTLCIIIDGFAMAFLFFGLLFIGDSLNRGRSIGFWPMIFIAFFALSMFFSWLAFRPNLIERAVRIVGFDSGMQNVILEFRNKAYRDAVLEANPMSSELISWIVKPGN